MTRRLVLALGSLAVLVALAGCSASGSITMTPVEDSDALAAAASTDLDERPSQYDLRSTEPVRAAIRNGSVRRNDTRPVLDSGLPVEHGGRYYDVTATAVGETPGYTGEIGIDYNATSTPESVIAYDSLPAPDRRALAPLLPPIQPGDEPGTDVERGVAYTDREADRSVLLTDQEYEAVRIRGKVYPVVVRTDAETLTTYRYDATLVAEDADAYAAMLDRRYAFTLSNLSDEERAVVRGAIDDTNYIEDDSNQGFSALLDRFGKQTPVERDDYDTHYVVRYDGTRYWATVHAGTYATDSDDGDALSDSGTESDTGSSD